MQVLDLLEILLGLIRVHVVGTVVIQADLQRGTGDVEERPADLPGRLVRGKLDLDLGLPLVSLRQ